MRTGATQLLTNAQSAVTVVIGTPSPEDVSAYVVNSICDEQIYGGQYTIILDNSLGTFDSKDYKGYNLTITHGFVGSAGSALPSLHIISQDYISEGGKQQLQLNCLDDWGLLTEVNAVAGGQYWNYDADQYPPADVATYTDKTIAQMITAALASLSIASPTVDDTDGYYSVLKPPVYLDNLRSGIAKLLNFTKSYLLIKSDGFHVRQPDNHTSVYTFDSSNTFWNNVSEVSICIPNKITYYGTDKTDPLHPVIIDGSAVDATSYARLGKYITAHFYTDPSEIALLKTSAQCQSMAEGTLSKTQGERNQGLLVAPMHCSLELFDKITISDTKPVLGTRTTTGYVHRLVREYDVYKGTYQITVYLGGIASGFTASTGVDTPFPVAKPEPTATPKIATSSLPVSAQAYITNLAITSVDYNHISWAAATVQLQDGRTQAINSGTLTLTATHYLYAVWGNTTLQSSTSYSDVVGDNKFFVGIASIGSSSAVKAYTNTPFGTSILINRDNVMDNLINDLKLASDAVTEAKIAALAVTSGKLAAQSVIAGKIAALSIAAGDIATDAITANKIQAGAVTAIKISAGAIDATKLASELILGTTIWAGYNSVKLDSTGIKVYGQALWFYYGSTNMGSFSVDSTKVTLNGVNQLLIFGTYGINLQTTYGDVQLIPSSGYSTVITRGRLGTAFNAYGYSMTGLAAMIPYSTLAYDLGNSSYIWRFIYGYPILQTGSVANIDGELMYQGGGGAGLYVYSSGGWRLNS
jgi:hypothetical protein